MTNRDPSLQTFLTTSEAAPSKDRGADASGKTCESRKMWTRKGLTALAPCGRTCARPCTRAHLGVAVQHGRCTPAHQGCCSATRGVYTCAPRVLQCDTAGVHVHTEGVAVRHGGRTRAHRGCCSATRPVYTCASRVLQCDTAGVHVHTEGVAVRPGGVAVRHQDVTLRRGRSAELGGRRAARLRMTAPPTRSLLLPRRA